jgi:hypothetical protein
MKKWEYKIDAYCNYTNAELNQIGESGWELTAVVVAVRNVDLTGRNSYHYYFKRPID